MKASIIISTFNRGGNLTPALNGLAGMVVPPGVEWEVLLVDNNSTDSTKEVILHFVKEHPEICRYLFEGRQGKSYALNSAVLQARGDVLVFTDDDCIPEPHWLERIATEFSSRPDLGILGGRVELLNPEDKSITIRTRRDRCVLSSASDVFFFVAGCNMAMRREVLRSVGDFDPRLCPGSRKDLVAEDADLIYRAFLKGFRIEYDPDVLVYHNHGRRSDVDVVNLNRKYLRGRGAFYAKHILKGDRVALQMAYWEIRSVVLSLVKDLFTGKSIGEHSRVLGSLLAGAATKFTP
jgi:glycosyltransferase involved in cell wall biosynthesis